ncbi:hypothetical protein EI94DRAFT_1703712 [Lactarius quietus]|nr:hypothetical protein EI94DRAFT_1703712 [Lactarius quietus]
MYQGFPAHGYSHYPHDDFFHPRHDRFSYDDYPRPHRDGYFRYHDLHSLNDDNEEYRRLYDDFRDHYPRPHNYEHYYHYRPSGNVFEEDFRGDRDSQRFDKPSREGQHMGGPEITTYNKRSKAISLPQASSVDLAFAQLPPRAEPGVSDASSNSNASPSVSSLCSELGRRGDSAVPANLSRFVAREDVPLPLPNSMSLGSFQARVAKGNEVNEVAVKDHLTNPVEKLVTL